jgi:hypothetical protein
VSVAFFAFAVPLCHILATQIEQSLKIFVTQVVLKSIEVVQQ